MPAAPRLKLTELLAAVVSNPEPLIVIVGALTVRLLVLEVTLGAATILATCTALPLVPPSVVTTAVRLPKAGGDGLVVKRTVNCVEVEKSTVPTAPWLKVTVLLLAVLEKLVPLIVIVEALIARLVVFGVTVGAVTTLATWTALPLVPPKEVTTAVKLPVVLGGVVRLTVN